MSESLEPMLDLARRALANAHAPYSRFRVGACLRTAGGRLYAGCNVENAAYPLGVCAERTAIAKAASEGVRPGDIDAVAVTASPCGGCRQWLHEWKVERVYFRRADATVAEYIPASALLPDTWNLP